MKTTFTSVLAIGAILGTLLLTACGSNSSAASSSDSTTSGAAATTTTASGSTTTAPASVNTAFTASDNSYSLKYPDGWTTSPVSDSGTTSANMFLSADGQDIFVADPLDSQVASSAYPTLGSAFLTGIKATNVSMGTSVQPLTSTSGSWMGVQGTGTFNGVASTITELGQDHNGKTFLIFTIAPTASADSVGNTYFQPMLDSLSFAS